MAFTLTDEQVRFLRLRAQGLIDLPGEEGQGEGGLGRQVRRRRAHSPEDGAARVAAVAGAVLGVQAQDESAMVLGVRARSHGLRLSDLASALDERRTTVRTWAVRGTLHLLQARDLSWLLPVLAPAFLPVSRRRLQEMGVDEQLARSGIQALEVALADGPLTRPELAGRVRSAGIDPSGQRLIHLIQMAAFEGLVAYGPTVRGASTFVRLADWAPLGPYPGDAAALQELASRYVSGYGPVSLADLAHWSGLPLGRLRPPWERLESQLVRVEASGRALFLHPSQASWLGEPAGAETSVRLLGRFDDYLLGYTDRSFVVPGEMLRRVHPGGGIIRRVVLVGGSAAGTWGLSRRGAGVLITVEPFAPLTDETLEMIQEEADDVGRFLGSTATLEVQAPSRS